MFPLFFQLNTGGEGRGKNAGDPAGGTLGLAPAPGNPIHVVFSWPHCICCIEMHSLRAAMFCAHARTLSFCDARTDAQQARRQQQPELLVVHHGSRRSTGSRVRAWRSRRGRRGARSFRRQGALRRAQPLALPLSREVRVPKSSPFRRGGGGPRSALSLRRLWGPRRLHM